MKEKEEISARINTRKYQPLQIRPMAMRSFLYFQLPVKEINYNPGSVSAYRWIW